MKGNTVDVGDPAGSFHTPLDMSAAEDILRWNPSQARAPAGSAAGGQFAAGSSGAAPTNAKPVGQGETGKRVSDLQKRLNALGAHLAVDGKFGPKTLAAVRAFQKAHGLRVDGLVGPKTTAALRLKHPAGHHHGHAHHTAAAAKQATAKPPARSYPGEYRTPETPAASTVHEPFGSPSGPGLFHHKGLQLPAYVQHVAHHLAALGHPESQAIQMAIGVVKDWAAGRTPNGKGQVHPDVQAAASKAVAEWEAAKGAAHGQGRSWAPPARERGWVPPPSPRQ